MVFKAERRNDRKAVALKLIKQEHEAHGFPKTALREINILRCLKQANVVELIEVVTKNDQTYLVMEYMEHDFHSLMRTMTFKLPEIKCIMHQLLTGLAYLHGKNIYHRDLKPNNILYNNRGEVKICDFGMANTITQQLKTMRIQIAQYRAPEIYLGYQCYDSKVDMWSAGMFLMELCLGKDKGLFHLAKNESQSFNKLIHKCGTPTEETWPGVTKLPHYHELIPQAQQYLMTCSNHHLDGQMIDLIDKLLTLNPGKRVSAEEALHHEFFQAYPPASKLSEMPRPELECNDATRQLNEMKKMEKVEKNKKTHGMKSQPDHSQFNFNCNPKKKIKTQQEPQIQLYSIQVFNVHAQSPRITQNFILQNNTPIDKHDKHKK